MTAEVLPIPVGARVAILVGVQVVGGPFIGQERGTVIRHREFWTGSPDYVVDMDNGDRLVFRPSLVVPAP